MIPPIFQILTANNAVTNIVEERIFRHGIVPEGTVRPYISWFVVSAPPENILNSVPDIDKIKIQVDCYSITDAGIVDLAKAVRDAIEPSAHLVDIPVNEQDRVTKLFRMSLEFDWFVNR